MVKNANTMEGMDFRAVVFAVAAMCIVALGGMALGYEVDLSVFGNGVCLKLPDDGIGHHFAQKTEA